MVISIVFVGILHQQTYLGAQHLVVIGVPPVIIQFRLGFSMCKFINHAAIGYPHDYGNPIVYTYNDVLCMLKDDAESANDL